MAGSYRARSVISANRPTTGDIVIRLATAGDAAGIHGMIVELAKATGLRQKVTSRPDHFLQHAAGDRPAFEAYIAERAGKALGLCLFFYSFSSWRGEPGVYVQDLYVSDEARGCGLGRRLIAQTVRRGKARGATYLRLSVARENTAAQEFYRTIGMSESEDECIYQAAGPAFERLAGAG
jgi:ribosomal protein S18 acetylase RimI-like enzyme